MVFKSIIGATCACLISAQAQSATVTYHADDYVLYTDVSNSLPGVTLTAVGTSQNLTGDVVIAQKPGTVGSPGTDYVFGHTQTNNLILGGYQQVIKELRIDLDAPTDYFATLFDKGNGISAYVGLIQAYDSTDTLLEEAFTGDCCQAVPTWASISRSSNDIAYIKATAWGGTVASIDAIEFNAVPIPAAVWLFGSGLIGLVGLARRKGNA